MIEKNSLSKCREYKIPFYQCPSFVFTIIGTFIIISGIFVYAIGNKFIQDERIVALVVIFITGVLFVLSYFLTKGFEKIFEVLRLKTEFINIISHQLRAPLSNLNWAVDFIFSGKLNHLEEKYAQYIEIIKENSKRMSELIDDLLMVAEIERGKMVLKKEEISLEEIISETISEFTPLSEASNVKIFFEKEKIPKIYSDPKKIKIVIENLLDNAIRYSKQKGEIRIKLRKKDDKIYFEIKDQGVGIPKEDQKYIFEKFFRSENALKSQTEGSGLGLFITKGIIEELGGKIGFKSKENKGSTFWFLLPIK